MTIQKGQPWGAPGALPEGGALVGTDAEARTVVEAARRARTAGPPIGLLGGDLCRTMGGTGDEGRIRGSGAVTFPIDVGCVLVDGRIHWFVAHLVARSRGWGRAWVAMNAQWLGDLNLAPRGHPGDGLLDIFDARLRPGDLWPARSRARHGAHLPHPRITEDRRSAVQVTFERPLRLWLDGVLIGPARTLSVRVEPDAARVVV
ncbi:MAG: hypothetical protein NVSMB12_03360 [Acidimicrobiales bacterium]